MGMAYDAARGQVVLFGGCCAGDLLGDTWTWDGIDWTQRTPAHMPSPRFGPGATYDARTRQVVLFGGATGGCGYVCFADTWTLNGTSWRIPFPAAITLTPSSGPPGATV